jgi:hypothetical protein
MAEKLQPLSPYPWAELYDIESGVKRLRLTREDEGPGRPPKPVKRIKTSITLTDEEKRIYEKLTYTLGSKLHPNKVTKGQVIGLALRLVDSKLEALPSSLDSWALLARILFEAEAESGKGG